jgi:putative membrane protein
MAQQLSTSRWCYRAVACCNDEPIMLTVKSLHIIFMVTWFAGLFYLPRLFVYHALTHDREGNYGEGNYRESNDRFKVMERKLFYGIMTPGAVLTIATGLWLWIGWGFSGGWLHAKLLFVAILIIYHIWCGKLLADFREERNCHSHVWYRWFNEFPVVILVAVVFLVVMKPF